MDRKDYAKSLLRSVEERDRKVKLRLKSIEEKIEKMSESELDSFLGLKSDIKESEWKHPSLSGAQLVSLFRRKNGAQLPQRGFR